MYILILLLPLLSFFISSLFGSNIGMKGVKLFTISLMFFTFMICLISWMETILFESNVFLPLWNWMNLGLLEVNLELQFDVMMCSMLILMSTVSFFVHLYSIAYMSEDPHLPSFMSYLSLFTFFMMVLVTSSNLPQLFIGWEGVGLCSYLLMGFWFTSIQANKAAMKAMMMNKMGDIGLLLGMVYIWGMFGDLNYSSFFPLSYLSLESEFMMNWMSFLLLMGVVGKSAQIGLHMWLPDAMEGPTPVSALMHAATMVTAGVFLIISLSPLFEQTPFILLLIVLLGSLTAFFSSTMGLTQNDLKKVMAYSTCSQLGYMMMMCGFSQYNSGLFHLMNHGFFKALLFLSAGSVIHALSDEQDMSKMGIMSMITPLTYMYMFVGSISLMGLPFLTGFYSKDLMLELVYNENYLAYALWLGLLSAFLTAFYSFSMIYYTFVNITQSPLSIFMSSHEGSWSLLIPLLFLLIFSMVMGYLLQLIILKDEFPMMMMNFNKFLPLLLSLTGALISVYLGTSLFRWWKIGLYSLLMKVYSFTSGAWYFDTFFNYYIVSPTMKIGFQITYKLIDNQVLEVMGPTKITDNMFKTSNVLSKFHLGKISVYTFIFMVFVCCFLFKF